MKILATSDTHGNLSGIDLTGIDLAVFAGDVALLDGRGTWNLYHQLKWMNNAFKTWCQKWPDTQIVIVPGNHDFFPLLKNYEKCRRDLYPRSLDIDLADNATMLIDEQMTFKSRDGREVKIYGTPWVPVISHSWAFEAESPDLKRKYSKIPERCDILVVHSPPHISDSNGIDRSLEWGGTEAFGSSELAQEVFKKSPKMLFCGHIHSGDHSKTMLGSTECYNVSRVDERYEIAYDPLVLKV